MSNVLLSLIVARTVDAEAFGAFAIAFLVFSIILAFTRAVIGQPLQISFSSADAEADAFRAAARLATGAALLVGAIAGAGSIAVGFAIGGGPGRALAALGVCLPVLLLQDTARMVFFSSGRAKQATLNDGIWAVVEFGALVIALQLNVHSIEVPLLIWGGSAGVAAAFAVWQLGFLPRLRGALMWMLGQRRLTGYLLAEYVLGQGLAQVGILLVGVIGTSGGVGALRAAQVLLGPLGILGSAAFMFAIPELAMRPHLSKADRWKFCLGISFAMGAVTFVYAGLLLLIPDQLGRQLLGDTWTGAQSVLLPMCVLSLSAAFSTGPAAVLYGLGLARTTFVLNTVKAPLLVVLILASIERWGAVGAAWALASTEILVLPLWFWQVRRAIQK